MDRVRVIIDNWQHDPWYREWIPILIALISLITSLILLYWARKENIISHRPYVWASNYGVIDSEHKTVIPIPFRVGFRVKNSPARILSLRIYFFLNSTQLFNYTQSQFVRFPDENSEWNFGIGQSEFEKIMDKTPDEKASLRRKIEIKYSSLDGGKEYEYKLEQKYILLNNQWQDIAETAN